MPSLTPAADVVENRCALGAMGTVVTIRANGGASADGVRAAMAEVERLEALWSRFRPDSEVSRLAAAGGAWVEPGPETRALLETALELTDLTGGAFDVTADPSRRGRLESDGCGRFRLEGARLDLGGIAKGAAAHRVIELLRGSGATSAVVSFGQSSIGLLGRPRGQVDWRVGIRRPGPSRDRILGALRVTGGYVSTSGDYEQTSAHGNHILDPRTGTPAEAGISSATVACADGARAEALSTALIVLGDDRFLALRPALGEFEAVVVDREDRASLISGVPVHRSEAQTWSA